MIPLSSPAPRMSSFQYFPTTVDTVDWSIHPAHQRGGGGWWWLTCVCQQPTAPVTITISLVGALPPTHQLTLRLVPARAQNLRPRGRSPFLGTNPPASSPLSHSHINQPPASRLSLATSPPLLMHPPTPRCGGGGMKTHQVATSLGGGTLAKLTNTQQTARVL